MKLFIALFIFFSLPIFSSAQTNPLFLETNYLQVSSGLDPDNANQLYAIRYKSTIDTLYSMKKVFYDSTYNKLLTQSFFKNGLLEGPFSGYQNDTLVTKASYIQGKLNGERLTYQNGQVVQKAYFNSDLKYGIWEHYDLQGQLRKKIEYDSRGFIVSEQNF